MTDSADTGSTPSLYQEMKSLAQTAIAMTGLRRAIAYMDSGVLNHIKKNNLQLSQHPILSLDRLFTIYEGSEEITLYTPFDKLKMPELEYLVKISHNRSISCKVYNDLEKGYNEIIYSMMVRIPSQPQLSDCQTINCEIEFHSELDADDDDGHVVVVDLVTWFDETIDHKLVRRARTSHALIAGM
jgi:hypothetical protein